MIERVVPSVRSGHLRLAETGQIGRDDVKLIGDHRDQRAEHVAGRREAVHEQQRGRVGRSGLPVEHGQAVHVGGAVGDVSHQDPSLLLTGEPAGLRWAAHR
jgi:hypothetical protein